MGTQLDRRGFVAAAAVPLCLLAAACHAPADDGGWNPAALSAQTPEPTDGPPLRRRPARPRPLPSIAYERFCARRDALPRPLVAAFDGNHVVVVSETGQEIARVPGRPPVRWSASGRLLAVGPRGALWTWDGRRYEGPDVPLELAGAASARWAWSPDGDCALVLDGGKLDAFHTGAGANRVTLVPRGVESAAWGPEGRVALVRRERARRSLWVAYLATGRLRKVVSFRPQVCCVVLGGWGPGGNEVLLWAGPGASAMQDGWRLESVDAGGRRRTWGRTLPRPDTIGSCGGSLAALTGSDRMLDGSTVSLLRPGAAPREIAGPAGFTGIDCSGDGSYVVTTGGGGLNLYAADGSGTLAMDSAPGWTRWAPEWGPAGSGVLYVRTSAAGASVWFLPEGGVAPRRIAGLGSPSSRRAFDWTATPPSDLLTARP